MECVISFMFPIIADASEKEIPYEDTLVQQLLHEFDSALEAEEGTSLYQTPAAKAPAAAPVDDESEAQAVALSVGYSTVCTTRILAVL